MKETIGTILTRIEQRYPHLSPTHKALADFVTEHPDQAAFLSTHELARKIGSSATTVVRFVQDLGFSGYDAYLDSLQDYLRDRITPLAKFQDTLSVYGHNTSQLAQAMQEDLRALNDALADFSAETLEQAVDLLNRASHIYLIGLGISYAVAYALEFRMRRLGLHAQALSRGGSDLFEGLLALAKTDVVIVIGYHRPHPELFTAIDLARRQHAPVIALTDSLRSPLARRADVVLSAKRGPVHVLTSLVVPMSVANALMIGLAQKREGIANRVYENVSALEEDYRQARQNRKE